MDLLYIIIEAALVIGIPLLISRLRGSRNERKAVPPASGGPAAASPQKRYSVICPQCKGVIRQNGGVPLCGTPLRKCPSCGCDYVDGDCHELALEPNAGVDAMYDAGSWTLEAEASEERLADWSYFTRLAASSYARRTPKIEAALKKRAELRIRPYIERLESITELRFGDFRVDQFNEIFDRLNYDAHDDAAISRVVRAALCHYGINPQSVRVQVDYIEKRQGSDRTPMGTYTHSGSGGVVRVVMDPEYGEYDTVIAVVLHECAHAFLLMRGIRYEDVDENERFTDIAAIYLSGGGYILRGYFPPGIIRVGYLSRLECEVAQSLVQASRMRREARDAAERQAMNAKLTQARSRLRALLEAIAADRAALHPSRVTREASIQQSFHQSWQTADENCRKAEARLARARPAGDMKPEAVRGEIDWIEGIETPLRGFHGALREWLEAERYQASLPPAAISTVRGIMPLVESGNAFAILEMIRFWHGCPATLRDAEIYYNRLSRDEGRDSLCALGLCSREGLCTPRDPAAARDFFLRAAALGSADAVRLLEEGRAAG